jgi:hypothetical protein
MRTFTTHTLMILIAALAALPLAAELSTETERWARRALLERQVREALQVDVGETEALETMQFTPLEIDGAAHHAVLLRRGTTVVLTVQRGLECLAHCRFEADGELALSARILAGQGWIFVDESASNSDGKSTLRRLFGLRGTELAVRQSWIHEATRDVGPRFRRTTRAELSADGNALRLATRVIDLLDGKPLADGDSERVLRLLPQPDGSLRPEVERDQPVALSIRLRHARMLERERLEDAALLLAREAAEQSAKLPADDARRLDAAGLLARLQARNKQVEGR